MSVIEEALRRAQETSHVPEQQETLTPSSPFRSQPHQQPEVRIQSASPAGTSRMRTALIAGGVALLVGLMVWKIRMVSVASTSITTQPLPAATPSAGPKLTQPSPSPSLTPRKLLPASPPRLSGIVGGTGEPLAIIDGNIMRAGETVDRTTLLEVRDDSARIRWHEQELVLRTNDR